jgi:hypothetical protein
MDTSENHSVIHHSYCHTIGITKDFFNSARNVANKQYLFIGIEVASEGRIRFPFFFCEICSKYDREDVAKIVLFRVQERFARGAPKTFKFRDTWHYAIIS